MANNDDSEIIVSPSSTLYAGPDATALLRANTIKVALNLYAKTGIKANRAYTPTKMLAAAGKITGKTYKRGQYTEAAADLQTWINAMKAAIPITVRE